MRLKTAYNVSMTDKSEVPLAGMGFERWLIGIGSARTTGHRLGGLKAFGPLTTPGRPYPAAWRIIASGQGPRHGSSPRYPQESASLFQRNSGPLQRMAPLHWAESDKRPTIKAVVRTNRYNGTQRKQMNATNTHCVTRVKITTSRLKEHLVRVAGRLIFNEVKLPDLPDKPDGFGT